MTATIINEDYYYYYYYCRLFVVVELQTISTGLWSQVRIQSINSHAYLCFSKKGKLIVKVRFAYLYSLN